MNQTLYTIHNRSNMHVGSGQANYGVIDQLVQRDATYRHPVIHASSLKGAIKEYCHHHGFGSMKYVFGSEKGGNDTAAGNYKFFDAMLLSIPVRSTKSAYVHITCPQVLSFLIDSLDSTTSLAKDLAALVKIFEGSSVKAYCFTDSLAGACLEDDDIIAVYNAQKSGLMTTLLSRFFDHETVVVADGYFDRLVNDLHLPVIARNYLENGESKNLWYEQVVPRLSVFWSFLLFPEDASEHDSLMDAILGKDKLIQIGANASVGYGYCEMKKMPLS